MPPSKPVSADHEFPDDASREDLERLCERVRQTGLPFLVRIPLGDE